MVEGLPRHAMNQYETDSKRRRVRVKAFGGIAAVVDGFEVDLGAPQTRRVLGVLLAHHARTVHPQQLRAALWPDGAPASADAVVHVQVRRLRLALEPATPARRSTILASVGGGYRLVADEFDVADYETALARGRRLAEGDPVQAEQVLAGVLVAFAKPWAPFGEEAWIAARVRQLEEQQRLAEDEWVRLVLELGGGPSRQDQLLGLARAEPQREQRWAAAMQALYQAGRQVDALRLFEEARQYLVGDVGVEPGAELRRMEAAILAHDDRRLWRRRPTSTTVVPVPPTRFVGRGAELARLRVMCSRYRLVTVTGLGGVGKTRLVAELLNQVPGVGDGPTWWAEVGDTGPAGGLAREVADALGLGSATSDTVEPLDLLVAALAPATGGLLVIDNADRRVDELVVLVLRLLADVAGLSIVITARQALAVTGEQVMVLEPLPLSSPGEPEEGTALELLRDRLGTRTPTGDLRGIERRFAGLPLALELVAAAGLDGSGPHRRVDADSALNDALALAVRQVGPDAAQLLWRIGQLPGGADAAMAVALVSGDASNEDPGEDTVGRQLRSLAAGSLVRTVALGDQVRYAVLAPIRERARTELGVAELQDVVDRAVQYLRAVATETRPTLFDPPAAWGLEVLEHEHQNMVFLLHDLLARSPSEALALAIQLVDHWDRSGRWAQGRQWVEACIAAAAPVGIGRARALSALVRLSGGLGSVAAHQGDVEEALSIVTSEPGHDPGEGLAAALWVQLAIARGWHGDVSGADQAVRSARALAPPGKPWFQAVVDRYAVWRDGLTGSPAEGFERALALADRFEDLGDPAQAAGALYFAVRLGRLAGVDDVVAHLVRGRSLADACGARGVAALLQVELAEVARCQRHPDADDRLRDAAQRVERAGNVVTGAACRRDLGLELLRKRRAAQAGIELLTAFSTLLRLDQRGAALAAAGLGALARPVDEESADRLAAAAWALLEAGSGAPTPLGTAERVAALVGPRPARIRPVDPAALLTAAGEVMARVGERERSG